MMDEERIEAMIFLLNSVLSVKVPLNVSSVRIFQLLYIEKYEVLQNNSLIIVVS